MVGPSGAPFFQHCGVPHHSDIHDSGWNDYTSSLFQAICARIYMLRSKNLNFIQCSRALLNENKWRTSRYRWMGTSSTLVGKKKWIPVLIYELLDFSWPGTGSSETRHRIAYVHKMLETGTGADRQLAAFWKVEEPFWCRSTSTIIIPGRCLISLICDWNVWFMVLPAARWKMVAPLSVLFTIILPRPVCNARIS